MHPAGSPQAVRQALEEALADDPDDVAAHAAYADLLMEQGDPRGELIRVQLRLEDKSLSAEERRSLRRREKQLLDEHGRDWLGGLAPYFLDPESLPYKEQYLGVDNRFWFARGWLDTVHFRRMTVGMARQLRRLPLARLLRCLVIHYLEDRGYEPGPDVPEDPIWDAKELYPLRGWPVLARLRVFQLGREQTDDYRVVADQRLGPTDPYDHPIPPNGRTVVPLVAEMSRLEELYLFAHDVDAAGLFRLTNLTRLRVLQLYHLNEYPLEALAGNPNFGGLTHLLLHPHATPWDGSALELPAVRALVRSPHLPNLTHLQLRLSDMGDAGVEEIVRSGILRRLTVLDLRHGAVTDAGARLLAECPDVKHLKRLDLQRNRLTGAGIALLRAAGVNAKLVNQHQPDETGAYNDDYLYEGDVE